MISKRQLSAKIDQESRTVKFIEDFEVIQLVDNIDFSNRRIVELMA
jgi:hypothetical protein